jgi:hypothetical protein
MGDNIGSSIMPRVNLLQGAWQIISPACFPSAFSATLMEPTYPAVAGSVSCALGLDQPFDVR